MTIRSCSCSLRHWDIPHIGRASRHQIIIVPRPRKHGEKRLDVYRDPSSLTVELRRASFRHARKTYRRFRMNERLRASLGMYKRMAEEAECSIPQFFGACITPLKKVTDEECINYH